MAKEQSILDLSNSLIKKLAVSLVKGAEGLHWFELRKCRDQRTSKQNRWFHGVILPLITRRISELWGEDWDTERTKSFLKDRFLRREVFNKDTGESRGCYVAHTSDLDTKEFGLFVDDVVLFCAEQLELEIPVPGERLMNSKPWKRCEGTKP